MRAVTYQRFGPADQVLTVEELPTPSPGPGEVLVRLAFSGVNPSDAKARAGNRPGVTRPPFARIIPHSDGSGVIEATGEGLDPARIGQRVWIWNGQWQRAAGTAADYIALPAAQAVPMPKGMSLETGATLGIPGLTAAQAVFGSGEVTGKTLLISGGAGAVGHNAVQLAHAAGARVIATASPSAFDRVRAAGAEQVFDYRAPDLAAQIMEATGGAGIDRAIEVEFGLNAPLLAEVMKPNSTILTYGSGREMAPVFSFGPFLFKALKIDILLVYLLPEAPRQAAITRLHDAITAGQLTPAIADILPLNACARAHDLVMQPGRSGAVLLKL